MLILTEAIAEKRYGPILNGKWANEREWMTILEVPDDIADHWINTGSGMYTDHIYCNRDLIHPLQEAFVNLRSQGLIKELKSFDGCFHIRDVRGHPGHFSAHSWGIAIDVNAHENPLGKQGLMTLEFAECLMKAGLTWGGHFKRLDMMHFSLGF